MIDWYTLILGVTAISSVWITIAVIVSDNPISRWLSEGEFGRT